MRLIGPFRLLSLIRRDREQTQGQLLKRNLTWLVQHLRHFNNHLQVVLHKTVRVYPGGLF